MYHYLFTNDLRISRLDESLKEAGKCYLTNTIPSSIEDKSANNNIKTLGFYFNFSEDSNCAKYAADGKIREVVLNFIKKFQFPNLRTQQAYDDAIADGIQLVPMRLIVKLLYTMNLLYGNAVAYLTKDEIKNFIFYNDSVAKVKNPEIAKIIEEIVEYRKSNQFPSNISTNEDDHDWKQEDRQIREMIKVLLWSGCIQENEDSFIIDNDNLSERNKADIFDIITCDTFWSGSTIESYREYMDMPDYVVDIEGREEQLVHDNENPEERNKRLFKYWMGIQVKPESDSDAGQPYSIDSINSYVSNISNTPWIKDEEKSLFYTTVIGDVQETIEILDSSEKKNNTQRSAVRKYLEYLIEMEDNQKMYDEIMKHNLWGIHIKKYNDALSETNPHVCIGWSAMGDLSGLDTTEEIKEIYKQDYPNNNNRAMGQDVGMIRRFIKELQIGDYIIFAESSEFHIGRIESDYIYDDTEYPEQNPDYVNIRKVKWLKTHISRKEISSAMHKSLATAMSIFGINDYRAAVVDLLKGTYKKDDDTIEDLIESVELKFKTDVSIPYDLNRIVFGAPGTGKSFELKRDSENVADKFGGEFERVTFHPEYTYSQFVGTYKPIMDEDGVTIKYQYVPGPFMRVLAKALQSALSNDPKPYILIIEEINRAKVAAVFGEVFQLLDRDDEGKSEYEIHASEDIRKHLADVIDGKPSDFEKLRIPNNMFIWATMNSADQGVFPMDTAFKRRWSFEYLGINEGESKIKGKAKLMVRGTDEAIEWNRLRKAINDKMASGYNVNEDKLMGPFFIAQSVLESNDDGMLINPDNFIKVFKNKVIMYLYEDAVKQNKRKFFDGCEDSSKYSSVCEAFDHIGLDIFGKNFKEDFYDKVKE